MSPSRTDDNSLDAPIGVMVDGIYLGSLAGQVIENFDLERVEILRGPQGTLFGKNTVGGVIHVIRSRPTGDFGVRLKATVGEDGQQEVRAVVNTSVIEGTLAAKFFGTLIEDDGFMKNVTIGGNTGETDYKNFGATFLYTPNERFEAIFTMEKFIDDSQLSAFNTNYNTAPGVLAPSTDPNDADYSGGFLNCLIFGGPIPSSCRTSTATPGVSENDTENVAKLDTDAMTLSMRYDINENLTLVSTTGYRELEEDGIFDFDGSAAPFITIEKFNDYEQFTQEFRIDGNYDKISFTAGLYYFNNDFDRDWITGGAFWSALFGPTLALPGLWQACQAGAIGVFCDPGIPANPAGEPLVQLLYETQETTSYAIFGQADWEFAEDWTLTLGIRWTREEKDFLAGQAYLTTIARQNAFAFPDFSDLKNEWTETSPKLGLAYQVNESSMLYASYSEGFHSGGFFGVNQNTVDYERDQYQPEFADSYELGYKSMLMEGRLRLNVAAFRNEFSQKQESSIQADPTTKTVATVFSNVADVVYQGIEIESEFRLTENLRVFFNYGYLDAEYKEFETDINANDAIPLIEDASFLTPRDAPKFTLGLGGTFSKEVGNGIVEIYTKYTQVDDVESNLLNTELGHIDSREDLTASIGYFTKSYSVVVFGRNLTDEQNEVFTPIGANPGLFAVGTVNRGTNYGLEFTYEM
ncbi:MAG: iron complex outermembrane receptor protein [Candidatus Azotimanducaceae bacterium]